ncbi:unnamed protein product [Kuraishia capsulata CBS 1993]|uniref:Calcineurin-like phosphoesterase domain-containing protein n=1 Tax=Kuraishia capsulata CBS 1993 TaxID=1382522 RepID=W6MJ08_9ASCO|nr:uncharacterized protein KUCA_T00000349001 [Kuraishia capsulata CBS 1993]CDK24387.1 unnamed protein product [Kuraishia capsulata CBS 1993]
MSISVSAFAPRAVSKYRPLLPLLMVWGLLFYTHIYRIPRMYAASCAWDKHDVVIPADEGIEEFRVMIVADPQLIDNHTYPGRNAAAMALSRHTVDSYLYRNFRSLSEVLKPDSVIFLGDLLDNGRSAGDEYYTTQVDRFYKIFQNYAPDHIKELIFSVPGNHDIGWADGVNLASLERFQANFGETNAVLSHNGHDIVMLDTISLSNKKVPQIYDAPRQFLDKFAKVKKDRPRILLTHVPLFRDPKAQCGPMRESASFPIAKGYQYQTVLDKDLSDEILAKVKPDLILSGDDHDYCELYHPYKDQGVNAAAKEITVKSISMAMGINRPAVELITLYNKPVLKEERLSPLMDEEQGPRESDDTTRKVKVLYNQYVCYLPMPYHETIFYGMFAGLNVLALFFWSLFKLRRSLKPAKTEEEKGIQRRTVISNKLSHYLSAVEEEEKRTIDDSVPPPPVRQASWIADPAEFFGVKSLVNDTSRHQLYKRMNLKLVCDQCFVLAVAVLGMYGVAVWFS